MKVFFEFDTGMLTLDQDGQVFYADRIALRDTRFVLDQAKRNAMLQTGKRIVHAWCEGYIYSADIRHEDWIPIRYQPQQHEGFHFEAEPDKIISTAEQVYIDNRRAYIYQDSPLTYL